MAIDRLKPAKFNRGGIVGFCVFLILLDVDLIVIDKLMNALYTRHKLAFCFVYT